MDRLPRDIAAEKMHQDILQMLDEYRVTSPGAIPLRNGMPSPNDFMYMQPHKTKSKQRRNKNNMQMKDHLTYSPDGVKTAAPRKSKSKKKNSVVHSNGQNGESSSMGTLSPGEGVESPSGYDLAPPTYDNVCGQGNLVGLRHSQMNGHEDARGTCAQIPNRMDDHCVMSNHYQNDHQLEQHHRLDMMQPAEWLSAPQVSMSHSPIAMAASIPTPPSTNSSHNSPIGMDGKHSPLKGKMLPTSPPHYYAVHRLKSPIHQYPIDNYSFDHQQQQQIGAMDPSHHPGMQYTAMYDNQQKMSTPRQIHPQYPTPPSQHSYLSKDATPPQGLNTLPENILTPSPDSPGHWSSSSPHSAQSDWSEGISSPVPPVGQHHMNKGRAHNVADGPVFI